jgi:hypothetical protein
MSDERDDLERLRDEHADDDDRYLHEAVARGLVDIDALREGDD